MLDEVDQQEVAEERQEYVLVDILSGQERRRTDKEEIVQRMIQVLAAEYRYPLEAMGRDVAVAVEQGGRRRSRVADLVVYRPGAARELANAERLVVVQPPGMKPTDPSRGVELLKDLLDAIEGCEFGLWTNGRDVAYLRKVARPIQSGWEELSDFPGNGESLDDLTRPDRRVARVPVAGDLRETILRCHDYLYGNQAMRAERAFAELIKLIFSKIFDERQLRSGAWSQRRFWVGVTERNNLAGQVAIAERIRELFALACLYGQLCTKLSESGEF